MKRNRARVLVIGAALLLAAGVVGKGDWFPIRINGDSHESRESREGPRGAAIVPVQQLIQAYRDDPDAADDLYRHREMVVTGPFVRIAPDGQGDPDLRLGTSDPAGQFGADLIRASHEQATRLRPGQVVTVGCQRIDRSGDERWLRNCAIQSVADVGASAPPAAPAPPAERIEASPPAPPAPPGNGG
ncbi:OB-fold putative lipoprotein [Sphingomonas parva]|uniref:OB-fold putative lipoprotein n=1 Tax=Sphingomonas parva TaxID=2555898 RepID=UPI001CDD0EF7|nr:OB-fold putative lipoprotein [Sphingomonas parva]